MTIAPRKQERAHCAIIYYKPGDAKLHARPLWGGKLEHVPRVGEHVVVFSSDGGLTPDGRAVREVVVERVVHELSDFDARIVVWVRPLLPDEQ